jgi:hypothetical protein
MSESSANEVGANDEGGAEPATPAAVPGAGAAPGEAPQMPASVFCFAKLAMVCLPLFSAPLPPAVAAAAAGLEDVGDEDFPPASDQRSSKLADADGEGLLGLGAAAGVESGKEDDEVWAKTDGEDVREVVPVGLLDMGLEAMLLLLLPASESGVEEGMIGGLVGAGAAAIAF